MSPTDMRPGDGLSRRQFAELLAAVGAAGLFAAPVAADEPKKDEPKKDDPKKPEVTQLQAIEAIVRELFGKHLTDEQVPLLSRRVLNQRATGNALKRAVLKNSDEPAFFFQAD